MNIQRTSIILCLFSVLVFPAFPADEEEAFQDDPKAHALFDGMVKAMRAADSLSWTSEYSKDQETRSIGRCTYKIWLKKPNYARVEVWDDGGKNTGVLILDGYTAWTFWPEGKPAYGWELEGPRAAVYEENKMRFYMKSTAPPAEHSISYLAGDLDVEMGMTIIDPSIFHGCKDALRPYLDGVKSMGKEEVDGELFDKIEVSFMEHQRSWLLWISPEDHLPRKLEQVVRVSGGDIITKEAWSELTLNEEITRDKFKWQVPRGWRLWRIPELTEGLLPVGTEAPDFELTSLDRGKIKLSDYRGKTVWLYKWRCG